MTSTRTQKWIVGILSSIMLLTVAACLFELRDANANVQLQGKQIEMEPLRSADKPSLQSVNPPPAAELMSYTSMADQQKLVVSF